MGQLQLSLRKWMIAFTLAICMTAVGGRYWRDATRPDLSFEIVVDFSKSYSPPTLDLADVVTVMHQMAPDVHRNQTNIEETIANTDLRVLPYGENAVQIVARGKSWQMPPARIELLARAAAKSISHYAIESGVDTSIASENRIGERRGLVPKSILADYDRTRQ